MNTVVKKCNKTFMTLRLILTCTYIILDGDALNHVIEN